MRALDVVLERLEGVRANGTGWHAHCPAHDDRDPSLVVSERDDGNGVVLHCHAGCDHAAIVAGLGLSDRDLFDTPSTNGSHQKITETYSYLDESGEVLFQVVRMTPKGFRQRRPDGRGGWIWKLGDTRRVLYRLPEVVAAVAAGETVYIVEGEKDADAIAQAGHVATCNPQGAGSWAKVPDAAEILTGARVVIVPDRDEKGDAHARDVVRSLKGRAAGIVVAEAATGKDAADHLGAGHSIDELEEIANDNAFHLPTIDEWLSDTEAVAPGPDDEAPAADVEDLVDESYQPVDLGPVLAGEFLRPEPTIMRRDQDRRALFYRGVINGVHGDSGVGKGWVTLFAVAQQIRSGSTVMLIDTEDTADSIVDRLRNLGATDAEIAEHLIYLRPQAPFGMFAVDHLVELVEARSVTLVVIDSLGECFGLDSIDENSDAEVGPWLRRVPRRIAEVGPAVVVVDHSTKANDNPLHPSGSKRKRAAIGGASYLVEAVQPLTAEGGGRLRLICAKDRHGHYGRNERAAELVATVTPGGTQWKLYEPHAPDAETTPVLELAVRAAIKAVEAEGRTMSHSALIAAMTIRCATDIKRGAVDLAVSRGLLIETAGPRKARLFTTPEEDAE